MRYEDMKKVEKEVMLERLYKRLNKRIYENTLTMPYISVADHVYSREQAGECYAAYSQQSNAIAFSSVLEQDVSMLRYQGEQCKALACIMLHEMAHQYCYENGIDDSCHGEEWHEVANNHGLCVDDNAGHEHLSLFGALAVVNFKM